MILIYFFLWFALLITAVINGALRQGIFAKYMNDNSAHQLSTLTGIILFAILIWIFTGIWKLQSASQAITIGIMWVALTLLFEFGFFHYVMKHPWSELLADYNIFAGRVWVLVLLWVLVAPYVFYKLRS